MDKIAIVTSGGGMSCSYSVGAILALVEKFGFTRPDLVIGGSGSAGTLAYYTAGQYSSIRNIWENLLCTKKFINPLRIKKILDIDYLIDEVFKNQDPLNIINIHASQIELLISCTNSFTGKVKFFSNHSKQDIFEILRATKAMPVIYGKSVNINGEEYNDTYGSAEINLFIKKAIEEGATKIIAIDNLLRNPICVAGFSTWLKFKSKQFRYNYHELLLNNANFTPQANIQILKILPTKKLITKTLNNSRSAIKQMVDLGYSDASNNSQLKGFL